ncbi:hypothetical protein ATL41_1052 [Flavimobilis soli]|uniref:DUF5709 domain-containing protein n=1 Tax=Flavimobilis soli TaxID=442709 RepID=A0A2A9EBS9_9MICO|nr:DUF5709 domain-containing protein [Flavimobilis soli]PFG36334.1 hypothetical protein ATL41_1052 [Flavimobilis soli]
MSTTDDPGERDSDQLPAEDQLIDRGVDDLLDEGISPPEHEHRHRPTTEYEVARGEHLDERLAQEEPDVWEGGAQPVDANRAGRLQADVDAEGKPNDVFAVDAGIDGGASSAEEAAMHVVPDVDAPGTEDGDPDETPDPVPSDDDDVDLVEHDEDR